MLKVIDMAAGGDIQAARLYFDRGWGQAPQTIEMTVSEEDRKSIQEWCDTMVTFLEANAPKLLPKWREAMGVRHDE